MRSIISVQGDFNVCEATLCDAVEKKQQLADKIWWQVRNIFERERDNF